MKYKTGKRLPVNKKSIAFGSFIKALPTVPLIDLAPDYEYGMDYNDTVGDCVAAGWNHTQQTITGLLTSKQKIMTPAQIISLYKTQNPKFVLNSKIYGAGTQYDNGMDEQIVQEFLVNTKTSLAFARIDINNMLEFKAAVYLGLGVMIGVQLQEAQQNQFSSGVWDYVAGSPTEGGHCIIVTGFNSSTGLWDVITWGKKIKCTQNFLHMCMDEAWFTLMQQHVDHPSFRNNFDLIAFSTAVYQITEGKVVVPVPKPVPVKPAKNDVTTSNLPTANSTKVYNTASALLNTNQHGSTDPEVGCAMSVNNVFQQALGSPIGGVASTSAMYQFLQDTMRFTKVSIPQAGDVIISPTGYGNGRVVGHVGIVAYYGILSNNSDNGLFQEKWTLSPWIKNYAALGALPVEFYRVN